MPPNLRVHGTERVVKEIDVSILVHSSETHTHTHTQYIYHLGDALIQRFKVNTETDTGTTAGTIAVNICFYSAIAVHPVVLQYYSS